MGGDSAARAGMRDNKFVFFMCALFPVGVVSSCVSFACNSTASFSICDMQPRNATNDYFTYVSLFGDFNLLAQTPFTLSIFPVGVDSCPNHVSCVPNMSPFLDRNNTLLFALMPSQFGESNLVISVPVCQNQQNFVVPFTILFSG